MRKYTRQISGIIFATLLLVGMGWVKLGMAEAEEWLDVPGMNTKIRANHPRIILSPEKMEQVMAKVIVNDPDWQSMNSSKYNYISGSLPYSVEEFLLKWALLYKITNESIFLERIREALWDNSLLDKLNYQEKNRFRWSGFQYIALYDWLYDEWTAQEHETYRQHILTWMNFWRAYVGYDNGYENLGGSWSDSDVMMSLTRSFLGIGLALYGDHDDASVALDIAHKMWQKMEEVYWPRMGGVHVEGCFYGYNTRRYPLQYLIILRHGEGIGLSDYSEITLDMLKESVYYVLHSTSPDLEWFYPNGDMENFSGYSVKPGGVYQAYFGLELLELLDGTQEAMYLKEWIDNTCNLPFGGSSTRVNEMLFNNRLVPKLSYSSLPTEKLFENGRMLLSRSIWDFSQDNIWWGFQYNQFFVDHMQQDLVSYQIMRGDDFVTKEASSYWNPGRLHNTILVKNQYGNYSGGGSGYPDGECELKSYIPEDDYTYINVDASLAYSAFNYKYWESSAETVIRKFLHIKPNLFVVFDIVKTKEVSGGANKAITNHFMHDPVITDNLIASYEGDSRIFVKYLLPELADLSITKIDETQFYAGEPQYHVPDSQRKWHTLVESISNPSLVHFMHVIEVGDLNLVPKDSTLIQAETTNMLGARISDRVVMFSNTYNNTELFEPITYTVSGQGNSRHLIVDLKPNTQFTITNRNIDTDTVVDTKTHASSTQGTLYFDTTLGSNHKINITPTGVLVIRGDVNGDGLVNVVDVQLAVNQFLGIIPQTDSADLNTDGQVNVIDVQQIVNIILGGG